MIGHGKQCTVFTMSQWNYEAFMNLIVPELAKMCPNFVDADTLISKAGATMNLLTFDNVNYDVGSVLRTRNNFIFILYFLYYFCQPKNSFSFF